MLNKRVFVSGGAGVIGREMVPRLLKRGARVLVADLKARPVTFSPEVEYRQGDLNYLESSELEAFAPEVFIHLAATFERSTETYGFWAENFWHNVRLSHHLMTIAKDLPGLQRVVFASSYLIYDPSLYQFVNPPDQPTALREEDPSQPRNLTGMAKLSHEMELRFLEVFKSEQFTSASARIFRGYGRGSRDVISRWIRACLRSEPIRIFRPEGRFDFVYAADSAEGLIRIAETDYSGVINLGTGCSRSIAEVIDIIRTQFPASGSTAEESDIPFEASQADVTKLEGITGWKSEYTLELAIPEIIAYERREMEEAESRQATLAGGSVLITSSSKKVEFVKNVKRSAKKIHPEVRVVAADADPNALTRYVADEFWSMPATVDENLSEIIQGAKERDVRS